MVGWHHRINRHEFEQSPGDGDRHGGLVCCSPWGHKELDMTECLNNNNKSNKKTKVKIKQTDLSWSQNWLFLPNTWTNAEHVVLLKVAPLWTPVLNQIPQIPKTKFLVNYFARQRRTSASKNCVSLPKRT